MNSYEEAYVLYNEHAFRMGFSVRKISKGIEGDKNTVNEEILLLKGWRKRKSYKRK